ncbi:Putative amidase [Cladobotryum mycophilum]|uniref:Amidase n=1 Tax=Cladobotryum mycophilum TaxID=491253 RepID=A0ABR0T3T5_9HYPO
MAEPQETSYPLALCRCCYFPWSIQLLLPVAWYDEARLHKARLHKIPQAKLEFPCLMYTSLEELRDGLDRGKFTSVDLTGAYFMRIEQLHPTTNAVIEISQEAMDIAARLDEERLEAKAKSIKLGPLHGIPILLKDNIATLDDMDTTAGSYALLGARVKEESTVASKLREAGAILIGKTNMTEWNGCRGHHIPDGWSARGGQTAGIYYPKHNPRGSSSGSAVATSAGLCWGAIGTDTSGSIIMPADANNVVGVRPTMGLTSRHMVIPFSSHTDTVGTFTQTVRDAAYFLSAIAGRDEKDEFTHHIPFNTIPDYVGACRLSGLKGKKIGVPRHLINLMMAQVDPILPLEIFDLALAMMYCAGAIIVDNIDLPGPLSYLEKSESYPLDQVDFRSDLVHRYLAGLKTNPNSIHSLTDLLNFTNCDDRERPQARDTGVWQEVLALKEPEVWRDWGMNFLDRSIAFGVHGVAGALDHYGLDAIVSPSVVAACIAPPAGLPVITVPLGRIDANTPEVPAAAGSLLDSAGNRPYGISFVGRGYSEEILFAIAYAYEQMTHARRKINPYLFAEADIPEAMEDKNAHYARVDADADAEAQLAAAETLTAMSARA